MRKNIQFQEVQQFRQSWLWFLLISSSLISIIPLLVFILKGDIPLNEGVLGLGVVLVITGVNIAIFYYIRLETKISDEGIAYRWWPVFRKFSKINWNDVDYVAMMKYPNIKYGFHVTKKYGRVHNVDGNNGYQVVLNSGKKYFFGTQKKLSVESVLQLTGKMKL